MSPSKRNPFNSPIPKNFIQEWTSTLVPGLDDAVSFDDAVSQTSPLPAMTPAPLRERSFAESFTSSEAELIQWWLLSEEKKSGVDSTSRSPSPTKQGQRILELGSPPAKENITPSDNIPPLFDNPFEGSFKFFQTMPSSEPCDMFSPFTAPRVPPKSGEKRSVLADISTGSTVEFVPISWNTLYHCRPFKNEPEQNKIAWLHEASTHFRPSPNKDEEPETTPAIFHLALESDKESPPFSKHYSPSPNKDKEVKETPTNLNLTVQSAFSSQFSPLSMPSGLHTGKRPTTRPASDMASVRPILKSDRSNTSAFGGGQRAVRFDYPLTTVKRPTITQDTPTTWPYAVLPPQEEKDTTTDYLFRDIWEDCRFGGTGKEHSNKSWIPYQTPNSTSTGSSSSGGARLDDNASSESKTTVMITGKENSIASVPSTTTKSKEGSAKSHTSRRTPFAGKKLSFDRSSSERNIMKASV
eukprot:scaffold1912_cov167-Amphora_coffeaeformis.AAC.7